MNKSFFYGKNRGFSLVELMVAVAIIAIMTSVAVVSFSTTRSVTKLKIAQAEVAVTIRLAQSYALQGKTQLDPYDGQTKTPCGYGFRFVNNTNYIVFYNHPDPGSDCSAKNSSADGRHYLPSSSGEAERYTLKYAVTRDAGNPNLTEIYFTVPYAKIHDSNGNELAPGAAIVNGVRITGSGVPDRTVTITGAGEVSESQ